MAQTISAAGMQLHLIDRSNASYSGGSTLIDGIVSPEAQGGYWAAGYQVHLFKLAAWRIGGQEIQKEPLTVLRLVPLEENYLSDFASNQILRMKLFLAEKRSRGIVDDILSAQLQDEGLQRQAAEAGLPLERPLDGIGIFRLNRRLDVFEGGVKRNRQQVSVTFDRTGSNIDENAATIGVSFFEQSDDWLKRSLDLACAKLLPVKNSQWLSDGESPIGEKQFKKQLHLKAANFRKDRFVELWFDCGSLFGSHAILVRGQFDSGPTECGIAG